VHTNFDAASSAREGVMSSDMHQLRGANGDGGREETRRREIRAAAHELRTPLIAILGFAEVLMQEGAHLDEAERGEMLRLIINNAKAEEAVIDRWLEDRYPETRNGDSRGHRAAMLVLRGEVEELLRGVASLPGYDRVHVEIPSWINVLAERGALREIITNLLTNALKYSPPRSPIRVIAALGADKVTVTVHNSGTIPSEDVHFIFERGHRAASGDQQGHGLGLALVRELVTDQGGSVWAETGAGGTDLSFTLPLPALNNVYPFIHLA
jgi:signal transduction histidine kinase